MEKLTEGVQQKTKEVEERIDLTAAFCSFQILSPIFSHVVYIHLLDAMLAMLFLYLKEKEKTSVYMWLNRFYSKSSLCCFALEFSVGYKAT